MHLRYDLCLLHMVSTQCNSVFGHISSQLHTSDGTRTFTSSNQDCKTFANMLQGSHHCNLFSLVTVLWFYSRTLVQD